VPELPLILHGGLNVDGAPVSEGSEILAYYEGELIAKSTVGEEGKYSLNLNLTPENYTNLGEVEFYVNGNITSLNIPASEIESIINNTSGSIAEVDLEGSVSSAEGDSSSGNGGGTGEARVVEKDSASSENSTEAGNSKDASFSKGVKESSADTQEPVTQAGDEGGEGATKAGYSTFFTELLFVTALFGAFLVIKR
jgi:hypothetical protein